MMSQQSISVVDNDKEHLEEFFALMSEVVEFNRAKILFTGSRVEVLMNSWSVNNFAGKNLVDIDVMSYERLSNVYGPADVIPSKYRNAMYRYLTHQRHPCYCLIEKIDKSLYFNPQLAAAEKYGEIIHGPSHVISSYTEIRSLNFSQKYLENSPRDGDCVVSVHNPYWPSEAEEWISRNRSRGFALKNIIRRVVGYGCDFVNVSPYADKAINDHKEWRFSFSIAELLLIRNWSTQQRIVYRVVRVLYKMTLNKGKRESQLRTYYFKTMLLWAVDTRPHISWNDIIDSTLFIVMEVVRCLKNKLIPHYFLPSNNLLDHLSQIDLSSDVKAITIMCKVCRRNSMLLTGNCDDLFLDCSNEEMITSMRNYYIYTPAFLSQSVEIPSRLSFIKVYTGRKNEGVGFGSHACRPAADCLGAMRQLLTLAPVNKKTFFAHSADNIFSSTFKVRKKTESIRNGLQYSFRYKCTYFKSGIRIDLKSLYEHRDEIIEEEFLSQYLSLIPSVTMASLNRDSSSKICLVYDRVASQADRLIWNSNRKINSDSKTVAANRNTKPVPLFYPEVGIFTDVSASSSSLPVKRYMSLLSHKPGYSPTVPISWFINKAYIVNQYTTLLSDYNTAENISKEIIDAYNESYGNKLFADYSLPVLLTTRWIKMYDREMQKLLGLSALCRFVIHESGDRSVLLPLSPIIFSHYIQKICLMETKTWNITDVMNVLKNVISYFDKNYKNNTYDYVGIYLDAIIRTKMTSLLKKNVKAIFLEILAELPKTQETAHFIGLLTSFNQRLDSIKMAKITDVININQTVYEIASSFNRLIANLAESNDEVMPEEITIGNRTVKLDINKVNNGNPIKLSEWASYMETIISDCTGYNSNFLAASTSPIDYAMAQYSRDNRAMLAQLDSLDDNIDADNRNDNKTQSAHPKSAISSQGGGEIESSIGSNCHISPITGHSLALQSSVGDCILRTDDVVAYRHAGEMKESGNTTRVLGYNNEKHAADRDNCDQVDDVNEYHGDRDSTHDTADDDVEHVTSDAAAKRWKCSDCDWSKFYKFSCLCKKNDNDDDHDDHYEN